MSGDFVRNAADRFGPGTALIDRATGQMLTFRELESSTTAIAHHLLAQELKVCATWQPTDLPHVSLLLAALRCGVPIFPISMRWPLEKARALAQRSDATLVDPAAFSRGPAKPFAPDFSRPATILATSGSSGEPKRVVHTLAAHLASARASQEKIPLTAGCGWLLNLPLAHVSGLSVLFRCLLHGAAIVLPSAGEFAAAFQDARVTHASVVSTQLLRLLGQNISLPQFQALLAGGGPISADLVNAAIAAHYPIQLTYGMTEAASQITTTPRLIHPADLFSAGPPNSDVQLRLQDGVLEIRSPTLCLGYLEDGGRIRPATRADGWLSTGDQGRIDAAGEFWHLGRADRLFISGGENIHPETIERALEAQPEVRRAVVLPIADEKFGSRPVAFIAWQEAPAEAAVRERLLSVWPKFMLPTQFFPWPAEADPDSAKVALDLFRAQLSR